MTEPTLLDECAISKIEARIAKRDDTSALESACGEYNCSCHYDIPALCRTVKHLRAENELWSIWHVKEPGPCGHHPCHQYDLRTIAGNPDAAHGCASCEVSSLQSQLEQLRAENERLKSERMIVREDAERFIKQYLHSAQWEGERLMITFENEALIAALIGDVEQL